MPSPEALREMILEYRKKIDLYNSMIVEWERELGAPLLNGEPPIGAASAAGPAAPGTDPVALVRPYEFHGKSQTQATKIFLQRYGFPLSTDQLMQGLEKGGLTLGGATAEKRKANFATILTRMALSGRVAATGLSEQRKRRRRRKRKMPHP